MVSLWQLISFFKGMLPANQSFQGAERPILFQIDLFTCLRITCIYWRKPSVLEAGPSSTLFPCESCVSFWKEYFLQLMLMKVEKSSLSSKEANSADFKNHMYLSNENHLCYQLQHLEHCLPVKSELVLKGIFLQINVFKMEKGSFSSK
jgi:hypothetical protein